MNGEDPRVVDMMDVRLRRLHGGLDARSGFEERVFQRVAELERAAGRRPADLSQQFERRRQRTLRQLRVEAWLNGISACLLVLVGGALLLRFLPGLVDLLPAASVESPGSTVLVTLLALVAATAIGVLKATGSQIRLR